MVTVQCLTAFCPDRVYATGTPGQSTGVYTTLPGQNAVKHCTVTIG